MPPDEPSEPLTEAPVSQVAPSCCRLPRLMVWCQARLHSVPSQSGGIWPRSLGQGMTTVYFILMYVNSCMWQALYWAGPHAKGQAPHSDRTASLRGRALRLPPTRQAEGAW